MIPIVMVQVSSQKEKVRRLWDYCFDLDLTEIIVLKASPDIEQVPNVERGGNGAQLCFELAMKEFRHTPFFWMEVDAIPLVPGCFVTVVQEWRDSGKLFSLPNLKGLHPMDVASGIGIYPAGAYDIIPHNLHWPRLWDLWVYQEMPNDIHYTQLIQHTYAPFEGGTPMKRWTFPTDRHIIRPETLLFHSDHYQSLIGGISSAVEQEIMEKAAMRLKAEKSRRLGSSAFTNRKNLSTSAELYAD